MPGHAGRQVHEHNLIDRCTAQYLPHRLAERGVGVMNMDATGVTSLVFLLAELNVALLAGCIVLGVMWSRQRRAVRTYRYLAERHKGAAAGYQQFLERELADARCSAAPPPGAEAAELQGLARRLRVSFLQRESELAADAVDADPDTAWQLRQTLAQKLLGKMREAETRLASVLGQLSARQSATQSTEPSEEQRRHGEDYRRRFNTLHRHVLDDARASRDLRDGLRAQPNMPDGAHRLLDGYETQRQPLEGFLSQPDVKPLEMRHLGTGTRSDAARRLSRTRVLMEGNQARIDRQRERYRSVRAEEQALIQELRRSLDSATAQNSQLRHTYTRQIARLEENVRQADLCVQIVEKESVRRQRVIRDLLKRLEGQQDQQREIDALERTIDQFCEQAVELQGRISAVEDQLARADREILSLKAELRNDTPQAKRQLP